MIPVTINGVAPSVQFGLRPSTFGGVWDAPSVEEGEGAIPGRAGRVVDTDHPAIAPRDLTIDWLVARVASESALESVLAGIKALPYRGTLEVVLGDAPGRAFYARARGHSVTRTEPQLVSLTLQGSLRLRALDPYAYALEPTLVALTAGVAATLPQGSAPTWPQTRIMGPAINPTLTLTDAAGEALGTIGFTVTLGATEYLDIDHAAQTISQVTAGVASDAYGTLSSGDFFALPSQDPAGGSPPQLTLSAGSGMVLYRQAGL